MRIILLKCKVIKEISSGLSMKIIIFMSIMEQKYSFRTSKRGKFIHILLHHLIIYVRESIILLLHMNPYKKQYKQIFKENKVYCIQNRSQLFKNNFQKDMLLTFMIVGSIDKNLMKESNKLIILKIIIPE